MVSPRWYQELIEDTQKVIIVAEEPVLPGIVEGIRLSGISNIHGYLFGGFNAWREAGNKMAGRREKRTTKREELLARLDQNLFVNLDGHTVPLNLPNDDYDPGGCDA